jgi:AMP deaminase
MRLSVYGMERTEWLQNAKWVLRDWKGANPGPVLSAKNKWMVQIPRLWRIFRKKHANDQSKSFNHMLENIFAPMIEATLYPEKHPEVAELLNHIVGFDSVDDEGNPEAPCNCTSPSEWKQNDNPAYAWQLYYLWANIKVVNSLRKSKG